MTEHDFYQELIRENAVNDAAVQAKARITPVRTGHAWRKAAAIAAVSAAVLIGTVFAIPSARAEVMKWFGASSPAEYLTADPSERPKIPELEALVSSPDPAEDGESGIKVIPIDRTDAQTEPSEKAIAISDFLYENCDVALGDAVFDGETFYQAIRFNGLSGLYLFPHIGDDDSLGRDMFAVPVDPYAVWGLYEDGPEEKYLTGEKTLYEFPTGYIWYELPNGTRWRGEVEQHQLGPRLFEKLKTVRPNDWSGPFTEEQQELFYQTELDYLETEGGIASVAVISRPNAFGINRYIDENGYLTVRVLYQVCVIETAEKGMQDTDLFWADLGTISINMNAEETLTKRQLIGPKSPVAMGSKDVTVCFCDYDLGGTDSQEGSVLRFTKHRISTDGVAFTAETANSMIDAFALHSIRIRAILPDSWTDAERLAFADSIQFRMQINGEGNSLCNLSNYRLQKDGTVIWTALKLDGIPFEMLRSVKNISFIPELISYETVEVYSDNKTITGVLDPSYGETAVSDLGARGAKYDETIVPFPDCVITLTVEE